MYIFQNERHAQRIFTRQYKITGKITVTCIFSFAGKMAKGH
jgi:hypothetical protein